MPAKRFATACVAAFVFASTSLATSLAASERYGFGREATAGEIAAWDIDVRADGKGLPEGHGSVAEGAKIFAEKCAACHGPKADRAAPPIDALVGGQGTLVNAKPVKTVGSYWPYATTLFDFVRRAMPFNAPQSLSDAEVYALTAYILSLNKIVAPDTVLDAQNLATIKMPNRDGFETHDWRGIKATE